MRETLSFCFVFILLVLLVGCTKPGVPDSSVEPETSESLSAAEEQSESEMPAAGEDSSEEEPFSEEESPTAETESSVDWSAVSIDGVDEEAFLRDLDVEILKEVATYLQSAIQEEEQEEREHPELVITEGWTRIFQKEQYLKVVAIGPSAMKPLYWILYKSDGNGLYEYMCAKALQDISGVSFEDDELGTMGWVDAKEFLRLFTKWVAN